MTSLPIIGRSRQEQADMRCPACRTDFSTVVWLVIDAGERPELQAAVLDGTIAQFTCPACRVAGTITAPLLYHNGAEEQLYLAVPLSVESSQAVEELAQELHTWLLEDLEPEAIPAYLEQVELVAELDGLQAILQDRDEPVIHAIQEILLVDDEASFQQAFVKHRAALMSAGADRIFAQLSEQAQAQGDRELGRRIAEQRATLGRFRSTLQSRRAAMTSLLNTLNQLSEAEQQLVPTLKAILHAADPQEVYAARLQHQPSEQELLDQLLDRLHEQAQTEAREDLVVFFEALHHLRDR